MMVAFWPPTMLTQEQEVELKVMARRGVSIREMAKQLGCSRNMIMRYLRETDAQQYKPRETRTTKLDPYKGYRMAASKRPGHTGFPQPCCCERLIICARFS
jgi:transposase